METIQVKMKNLFFLFEEIIWLFSQWNRIEFLQLMYFGMKHLIQEIIIFSRWVVVIVGSKIFLYLLINLI
jgi:hypothetical protein